MLRVCLDLFSLPRAGSLEFFQLEFESGSALRLRGAILLR